MNTTGEATRIAAGNDGNSIAPTLSAFENSRIRLAIGYSDGSVVCNECGYDEDPDPASLRLCWITASDQYAVNVDLCDCHFGMYLEGAIGDALPLEDD